MLRKILRLLLPTVLYVWVFVTSGDDSFLSWREAKKIAKEIGRFADFVHPLERIAAWIIVFCISFFAARIIHIII